LPDYYEIPILGVATIVARERWLINGYGGPAIGFNTVAKRKLEIPHVNADCENTGGSSERELDFSDSVRKTDVGGVIGGDVVFHFGPIDFVGDIRWTFGIRKFRSFPLTNADTKNSAFSFMMGIGMRL
jgi:hypothetical protein